MFRMLEKQKDKAHLQGLENLTYLGGFIKEEIEDKIYGLYPEHIVNILETDCPVGPNFWVTADEIEKVISEFGKYTYKASENDYSLDPDEFIAILDEKKNEFDDWIIKQIVRITSENYKNGKSYFWNEWKLPRETKKALMTLNALDEKVMYYYYGIGEKDKLTAKQISELPEFTCSEEFIINVINAVERIMKRCGCSSEEFVQECDAHI